MSTFAIVVVVLAVAGGITYFLMKKGKIQDANNNNIPDAVEEKVEEVKEVVKKTAAKAKKEADLMEAFKTAGLTDDEQQKFREIAEESSAFGKALKADATLSEEEKAAKSKEYGKAKAARLKELLGAEKYKALKDVQNAQKEAAKTN